MEISSCFLALSRRSFIYLCILRLFIHIFVYFKAYGIEHGVPLKDSLFMESDQKFSHFCGVFLESKMINSFKLSVALFTTKQ